LVTTRQPLVTVPHRVFSRDFTILINNQPVAIFGPFFSSALVFPATILPDAAIGAFPARLRSLRRQATANSSLNHKKMPRSMIYRPLRHQRKT
jgi:hypothetical protein